MKDHGKIRWITRTGLLLALLIALQWATAGTAPFAGQYITGACVNGVLAVSALTVGFWSGAAVAVLSPFCAFFLGVGPKLIQLVPAIALGNLVFVAMLSASLGRESRPVWRQALGLLGSAGAKFAALYVLVVKLLLPLLSLPEKQIAVFTAMFSYPQLLTALLGGTAALLLAPTLRKALNNQ